MPIRSRDKPPFFVWIRKSQDSGTFTVRFSAADGIGALRLDKMGAVTPTLQRSQLGGLTAEHLRKGRFMHFATSTELEEYALWTASAAPDTLPEERWVAMEAVGGGLVPKGWVPAQPCIGFDEEITDLNFAKGRLGLAMRAIKQRRRSPRGLPGVEGAPPGLVRHLRRTITRQEQEIAELKAKLAAVRFGEKMT